jgi:hypothetical protein
MMRDNRIAETQQLVVAIFLLRDIQAGVQSHVPTKVVKGLCSRRGGKDLLPLRRFAICAKNLAPLYGGLP